MICRNCCKGQVKYPRNSTYDAIVVIS
uniref:Uncharacterized protein n=1 Tax=Rhizophora mucronata TaxID=61149 RepID=A0A2P2N9K1_RHIMU